MLIQCRLYAFGLAPPKERRDSIRVDLDRRGGLAFRAQGELPGT